MIGPFLPASVDTELVRVAVVDTGLVRVAVVDTGPGCWDAAAMTWSWRYVKTDGSRAEAGDDLEAAAASFPSQSDAESWVGETWRRLAEAGVDAVVLYEDERLVYGPMSLHEDK